MHKLAREFSFRADKVQGRIFCWNHVNEYTRQDQVHIRRLLSGVQAECRKVDGKLERALELTECGNVVDTNRVTYHFREGLTPFPCLFPSLASTPCQRTFVEERHPARPTEPAHLRMVSPVKGSLPLGLVRGVAFPPATGGRSVGHVARV